MLSALDLKLPDNFIFAKENSFPSFILESSLLITEASSVCLESFALGKPVIVVGNTGLTYDIPDDIPQELFRRSHNDDSLSEAIIHFVNLNFDQRASLVNIGKDIKSNISNLFQLQALIYF